MKKIIKTVVPATKKKIVEKTIYFCDICGKEGNVTECGICGRHCCDTIYKRCSKNFMSEMPPHYPIPYCPICENLRFNKYNNQFDEIDTLAREKKDSILNIIKEESLNAQNTK